MDQETALRIAQALEGIEVALTGMLGKQSPVSGIDDMLIDHDLDGARRAVARRRSRQCRR